MGFGMGLGLIFQNFDGTGMGLGLKIFRILITIVDAVLLSEQWISTLKMKQIIISIRIINFVIEV
jgi:hypothetical protein